MAWYSMSIHATKVALVPKVKFLKTALCVACWGITQKKEYIKGMNTKSGDCGKNIRVYLNSIRSKHINSKLVNIKSNNGDTVPGYKQDNDSDKY